MPFGKMPDSNFRATRRAHPPPRSDIANEIGVIPVTSEEKKAYFTRGYNHLMVFGLSAGVGALGAYVSGLGAAVGS